MSNAFDTVFPADSVEFCPHPAAHDVLVCGTYNLDSTQVVPEGSPQKRTGQCLVFQVERSQSDSAPTVTP
ncbi:hypothetical protein B0H10DRAFT_2058521 [Mycena sp. CBHHK59/15]|nr:hypothetical protein B0H10DRAFT_2058521 [Mycena sp. CBHHK59/15]